MSLARKYAALIFDYDGVIVPSTPREVFLQANLDAFMDLGVTPTEQDGKRIQRILGATDADQQLVQAINDIAPAIDPAEYWEIRETHASEAQKTLIREGAKSCYHDTEVFGELEVACAIVSNNQQWTIDFSVDFFDWETVFALWLGREPSLAGLRRQKPNDYYLRQAMTELDTSEILFVGDKESDLIAGNAAGVDTAIIARDGTGDLPFALEPSHRIESLHEL